MAFVEFEAGGLGGADDGEDGAVVEGDGGVELVGEHELSEALAEEVVAEVEGVFDGAGVGFAGFEGGEGVPADDGAGGVGEDADGVLGGAGGEPGEAFFGGGGDGLVGASGVEDVVVVDVVDGGEVGEGGGAEVHDGGSVG